ncbi:MAG: hypothetical protein LBO65_00240 [Spirochaetaceae bacterium]|jgi:ankyrin repeat protein|nr:hypothetical protein [Spirochaetaceae bacterium]
MSAFLLPRRAAALLCAVLIPLSGHAQNFAEGLPSGTETDSAAESEAAEGIPSGAESNGSPPASLAGEIRFDEAREAVWRRDLPRMESLLDAGLDPDIRGSRGETLLIRAVNEGFTAMADLLLSRGADPNLPDDEGKTAAWFAARGGTEGPALLRRLMEAGARLDTMDNEGISPLFNAVYRSGSSFSLILAWEEENSPLFSGRESRRSRYLSAALLELCRLPGRDAEVRALLKAGADFSAFTGTENGNFFVRRIQKWYLPLLLGGGMPVNIQDREGRTFLMEAGRSGELTRLLLDAGADPRIADKDGLTALMGAFEENTIAMLLEAGADARARDKNGQTVFHHLFFMNRNELRLLADAGADINAPDNDGITPIMKAIDTGTSSTFLDEPRRYVAALLELGADPLVKNSGGKTLLLVYLETCSLRYVDPELVRLFLDLGIDPAEADAAGVSPLTIVLTEKARHDGAEEVRSMILDAADRSAVREARSRAGRENRRQFVSELPERSRASLPLLLPLALIGLSTWTREGIYRDSPEDNIMGPVNAALTFGTAGAAAGFSLILTVTGGWGGGFKNLGKVLIAFLGGSAAGLIAGTAACLSPAIRDAFKTNRFLYYLPPAAAGVVFTIGLVTIWLD